MKKHILLGLTLLTFLFTSCEEVIDYELEASGTKVVVEGLVTDQPGPYNVRLTSTKGYLDEGGVAGVNGALVIISDNQGAIDTLRQVSQGLYQTTKLQGKPGNTYFLRAVVNGKDYTAQSYMPTVSSVDSLTFVYKKSMDKDDDGYHPYLHFQDPAGKGNYYRWNVFVNGKLLPDELLVLNDELYDGSYGHADMGFAVQEGDKVKVELYGIDKPAYEFWMALMNQQNAVGGPFESTPANAPSNITNGGIGFFGASAVAVVEAEVKAE